MDEKLFFNAISKFDFEFRSRISVENDPGYKQIIPYIVLQTTDSRHTAVYRRKGSEKRLHDLWSMGIGGHINTRDNKNETAGFRGILYSAMERELAEELMERPALDLPRFIGTINEEETSVGSVHMGVVFRILTSYPEKYRPGEELENFTWITTQSVLSLNLELWSELAFTLIARVPAAR